jgi:DNA repair exonuclease SbcCD ATPase subunit
MDKDKQIIIVSIVIMALVSGIAVFFYMEAQKELKIVSSIKPKIESVTAERIGIIKNIESLNAKKEELVIKLQDYSDKIQAYEAEIPRLKTEKEKIAVQLSEAEKESSVIINTLHSIHSQEASLKDELAKADSDYQDLLEALEYAGKEKSELEEKLKSYIQKEQGVQLGKIVVRVANPAEGKIVEVSKEYNFSVVDMGEKDNIKSGDLLEIYRNNKLIAKALVENVYDDMSSIIVFDQWKDVDIYIGDTVKLQNS